MEITNTKTIDMDFNELRDAVIEYLKSKGIEGANEANVSFMDGYNITYVTATATITTQGQPPE